MEHLNLNVFVSRSSISRRKRRRKEECLASSMPLAIFSRSQKLNLRIRTEFHRIVMGFLRILMGFLRIRTEFLKIPTEFPKILMGFLRILMEFLKILWSQKTHMGFLKQAMEPLLQIHAFAQVQNMGPR